MSMHNIENKELYARYLKAHPSEATLLFRELLINVTNFFRDADAFAALKRDILPHILAGKADDHVFRIPGATPALPHAGKPD